MKKWLIAVTLCMTSALVAGDPEKVEFLSAKAILENTNGYFVLSDGSCWKMVPFTKRWRTLGEWWNNVELASKEYESLPKEWHIGTEIAVYSKYENLKINEEDAANQADLKQCTHLLFNTRTGQILFATFLPPSVCISQIAEEFRAEGFAKGITQGRQSASKEISDIYNDAYAKGHQAGRMEGYRALINEQEPGNE